MVSLKNFIQKLKSSKLVEHDKNNEISLFKVLYFKPIITDADNPMNQSKLKV